MTRLPIWTGALGPAPVQPALSQAQGRPHEIAVPRFRLTVSELELLRRLRMTGFIASPQLMQAIGALAAEIAGGIARAVG